MPPSYFPLRWESTGDQWWYASPIDYAAANGHYDLVRELLRIDSNHLMKLTSLRRIRRLETVWDDDSQFHDVAACRSRVARKLFLACDDPRTSKNTLIRAGYGGWLMYTAASAGDLRFVHDLLDRNPLLVFGEGEYGVTDMLYAAARSKNGDVFRLVYEFAVRPRFVAAGTGGYEHQIGEIPEAYRWEMKNRALHAAARGGTLTALKELLLADCSGIVDDVLAFRDKNGSTILHAAAGKGQTQVVQELVASFDIINSRDNQGNTALHVAAFRGHAATVEALIVASPSLTTVKNNAGDTFLHTAVLGFQTPSFQRLDRHRDFMNRLTTSSAESSGVENIINCQNNVGRTALHMAISGNVHVDFVEMLMLVKSIDVNIRDCVGMTPLDLLRQKPRSLSSDLLIRRLVSAGGIFTCQDRNTRRVIASHLKNRGNLNSPGTCFRIPDAEIFLSTGLELVSDKTGFVPVGVKTSSCSIEMGQVNVTDENHIKKPRNSSVSSAAERLKSVFHWARTKDFKKKAGNFKKPVVDEDGGSGGCTNITAEESTQETHVPLRQRFSKHSSSQPPTTTTTNNNSNKRTLSVRSNQSSPAAKKKRFGSSTRSRSNSFSKLSVNSCSSSSSSLVDLKQKGIFIDTNIAGPSGSNETTDTGPGKGNSGEKQGSVKRRLKSHYFCFGASGLSAKTPVNRMKENSVFSPSVISVA